MTRRTRGREIALQVLYQADLNPGLAPAEVRRFIERRLLGDTRLCEFTLGLIVGVQEHQARIDALISEVAENWRIDRMAAIDRNILRLGAYEILYCPEVPAKVAINESLELAKRYSTGQSSRFVNGILDRLSTVEAQAAAKERDRDKEKDKDQPSESEPESESASAPGVEEATPDS
jgi:N utilization substance protein B